MRLRKNTVSFVLNKFWQWFLWETLHFQGSEQGFENWQGVTLLSQMCLLQTCKASARTCPAYKPLRIFLHMGLLPAEASRSKSESTGVMRTAAAALAEGSLLTLGFLFNLLPVLNFLAAFSSAQLLLVNLSWPGQLSPISIGGVFTCNSCLESRSLTAKPQRGTTPAVAWGDR